jgi:DNA-binding transcriptional LysR family regulator
LNTLHLKYAVEVERTGSITKAADRLYMNQPHLSKTIRELEETLGMAIFKRTSKGIVPTKKGTEFLAAARNILAEVEAMEKIMSDDGGASKVSLHIAVPRASYVSYAFTEFMKTVPPERELDVDYMETNSASVIEHVTSGECGIGIVRCRADYSSRFEDMFREKNLRFEPVREFEYLALMSDGHPLAHDDIVKCEDLSRYIEITHGDSEFQFGVPNGTNAHKEKSIAIYERGSQFEILKRIPGTYMWVSPMPEEVLSTFSLIQKRSDMPDSLHRDFLVSRRGYRLTEEDRGFIDKLRDVVKETKSI